MAIPEGLVPQHIVDRLNRRNDDAAKSAGIPEKGAAPQGTVPGGPVGPEVPARTAPADPPLVVRPPGRRITAASYSPVSTPGGDQGKPSELQRVALRTAHEVMEFRERPARANTRPVFSQMMTLASRRKFRVLVVQSLDCFARSLSELLINLKRLDAYDVRFITVDGNVDTDKTTETGRKFLHTLSVLVDAENRMIARKVRAGMDRAKTKGVHCGRPRRSFSLAEARQLREQGLSIRRIGARLGVPASTIARAFKA